MLASVAVSMRQPRLKVEERRALGTGRWGQTLSQSGRHRGWRLQKGGYGGTDAAENYGEAEVLFTLDPQYRLRK